MPARLTAELDQPTVAGLLGGLLPLHVDLDDAEHDKGKRWMQIQAPELLEFVPHRGIRIQTGAKLKWTVAGVAIPFTILSLRFVLEPVVQGDRLNLVVTIEDSDFKGIPAIIDRSIMATINARLKAKPDLIGWDFGKTLALRIPLPATMAPVETFEMDAGEMRCTVSDRALHLALDLPMRLTRSAS